MLIGEPSLYMSDENPFSFPTCFHARISTKLKEGQNMFINKFKWLQMTIYLL